MHNNDNKASEQYPIHTYISIVLYYTSDGTIYRFTSIQCHAVMETLYLFYKPSVVETLYLFLTLYLFSIDETLYQFEETLYPLFSCTCGAGDPLPLFSCGAGDPLPLFQLWRPLPLFQLWRPFTFVQWWRPFTPFFTYHEPHHCPVVRVHDELRQAGELCSAIPAITTMYQSITSLQLHVASYHHCPLRQNTFHDDVAITQHVSTHT